MPILGVDPQPSIASAHGARQTDLNEQRLNRIMLKIKHKDIETAFFSAPDALAGPLSRELKNSRQERFQADLKALDASIEKLDDALAIQARRLRSGEEFLIKKGFIPWLKSRRLLQAGSPRTNGVSEVASVDEEPPHSSQLSEQSAREEDSDASYSLPTADDDLLIYYLAFGNATAEAVKELTDYTVQSEMEEAGRVEDRLLLYRQRLLDRAVPLPDPTELPQGDGVSGSPAASSSHPVTLDVGNQLVLDVDKALETQKVSRVIDYRLGASIAQNQRADYATAAATPPPDINLTGTRSSIGTSISNQGSPFR
ncbi:hypothetical protein BST61_g9782 [Cercospora zeina]